MVLISISTPENGLRDKQSVGLKGQIHTVVLQLQRNLSHLFYDWPVNPAGPSLQTILIFKLQDNWTSSRHHWQTRLDDEWGNGKVFWKVNKCIIYMVSVSPFVSMSAWTLILMFMWYIYPGRWCLRSYSLAHWSCIDTSLRARGQQLLSSRFRLSTVVRCCWCTISLCSHLYCSHSANKISPQKRPPWMGDTLKLRRQETK